MMVKWHVDHRIKRILISKLHFHLPCEIYSIIRHKMGAVYSVYTITNFRLKSSQCCEKDTKNRKYNHSQQKLHTYWSKGLKLKSYMK